jgi:hypothetical protein
MDLETVAIIAGMITPVYIALFGIYQKVGKFERVCKEVDSLKESVYGRIYEHV